MLRNPSTIKRGDDGLVSVLVAIVTFSLLVPLLMLVLDVGGLYVERRQLQHAADAAVMAVARSCAAACDPSKAEQYGPPNTGRGADVVEVCSSTLFAPACTPSTVADDASKYDCEPLPAGITSYVQVQVNSKASGWSPWLFNEPVDVPACARAAIGPLGSLAGGFPVTMSICEWENATSGGYAPPPPYDPWPPPVSPDASFERTIELQEGGGDPSDPGCLRGPANSFVPGGFGWLAGDGCSAEVDENGDMEGGTGSSEEKDCKSRLAALWASHEPIFVPVHDVASGAGAGATYSVAGYGAFVITGYDLTSAGKKRSWLTNQFPTCPGAGGSGKCITGFFTQALAPSGGTVSSGSDFGASTPYLVS